MKQLLSILFCLGALNTSAQDFYWKKQLGSGNADTGPTITSDPEGNVFVAVQFLTATELDDTSFTAVGNQDVAIVKLDSEGSFIKAFHLGGFDNDRIYEIETDDAGNVYATGSSGGLMFGGTNYTSQGDEDLLIAKWDNDLNPQWLKLGGSVLEDRGSELAVDGAGNIYFTGYFRASAVFEGVNLTNIGNTDVAIGKINSNGTLSWVSIEGGTTWDAGFALDLIDDEHFVVGGEFINSGTIGGLSVSSSTGGNDESWVAKFDTSGQAEWVAIATNSGFNSVQGLASDADGNVYTVGYYEGTTDFDGDTALTSQGSRDVYLAKYSPTGVLSWVRSAGGVGFDMAYDLVSDDNGKLHLLGMFEQTLVITPSDQIVSNGLRDMMIISVSADGDLIWYAGIGGTSTDAGIGLYADDEGRVYGCGNFQNSITVDGETFTSNGGNDVFIAKISPCIFPEMELNPLIEQEICEDEELGITLFNTEEDVLYTVYANGDSADAEVQGLIELNLEIEEDLFDIGTNEITFSGLGAGCADAVEMDTVYMVEVHENPDADFLHEVISGQSEFTDESDSDDLIVSWEWDIEGTMETTQDVSIALANGDYDVCLSVTTEFGCEDEFCETVSVLTGIKEYGVETLNLRYDAFNQILFWTSSNVLTVEIFDMNGKLVLSEACLNQLNVSELKPQIYAVRMLDGNELVISAKLLR